MRFIIVVFLLVGYPNCVYSQECSLQVEGYVLDEHDNGPVSGAKVYFKGTNYQVLTDSNGYYRIDKVCSGEYELICFHHIGCEPEKRSVRLEQNQRFDFKIEFHFLEFEGLQIVHYKMDRASLSTVKMSELEKLNSAGKTFGEQLKVIPGVTVLSTGSSVSKPVIHGLHSNRVILMNNDVRQEGQQWGSEHAPEIDPFLSSEISVVKGASAVKYGPEAIGGVLLANAPEWEKSKPWKAELFSGYNTNGRQGYVSGRLENNFKRLKGLSTRIHGTLKKSGNVSAPNYILGNTGFEEFNFSIAAAYKYKKHTVEGLFSSFNTRLGIFSGSHIGNLTDLNAAFLAEEPMLKSDFTYSIRSPKQRIQHDLSKFSWRYELNQKHTFSATYALQTNDREEFDVDKAYGVPKDTNVADFRLLLNTQNIDVAFSSKWNKNLKTDFGLQYQYQENARAGRFLVPNFEKQMTGVYGLTSYKLKDWNFEAGIRYDNVNLDAYYYINQEIQTPNKKFENISSTIGASKSIGHHWVIRMNSGLSWRPPSISELYSNGLHHGAASIEVGDESLIQEQAWTTLLGFEYKAKRMSLYMDAYHMQFKNYIYLKPNGVELSIKGAFPSFKYEQIDARYSGLDVSGEYKISDQWSYNAKYSLVRVLNLTDDKFVIGIPADRLLNGLLFSRKLKKDKVFRFSSQAEYVFTQNRFDVAADFVDPPSDYLLLNANLNFEIPWKNNRIVFALVGDNLLNKTYRDYMNRFRYFANEMGRNVGIKINYKIK